MPPQTSSLLDLIVEGEEAVRGAGERALTASLPVPLADARLLPPTRYSPVGMSSGGCGGSTGKE
ncbi:hypothetical protein ABT373_26380 [Streptomyces sp. NPDC000070]|uniref:hypothetical protein n=1 Tax=Streptomyces sp. NPDC000070 TaxID=3154240 RepID=UPI00331867A0